MTVWRVARLFAVRYEARMPNVTAIYHRTKQVNTYAIDGDRFLIEAFLQDEIHDVHAEIEILHHPLKFRIGPSHRHAAQ